MRSVKNSLFIRFPWVSLNLLVLKDGMLPYRRLSSADLEERLDKLEAFPENPPQGSSALVERSNLSR
jgi:hypothetical protein